MTYPSNSLELNLSLSLNLKYLNISFILVSLLALFVTFVNSLILFISN